MTVFHVCSHSNTGDAKLPEFSETGGHIVRDSVSICNFNMPGCMSLFLNIGASLRYLLTFCLRCAKGFGSYLFDEEGKTPGEIAKQKYDKCLGETMMTSYKVRVTRLCFRTV